MSSEQIAIQAYRTKDFQFVTAMMACDEVEIEITDITPFSAGGGNSSPRGPQDHRVTMHILGIKDGNYYDITEQLESLSLRYINGKLRVDPLKLVNCQRTLRALVVDKSTQLFGSKKKNENKNKHHRPKG